MCCIFNAKLRCLRRREIIHSACVRLENKHGRAKREKNFPNDVISDSATLRTSAWAAIEFIIMHLCRLKLILGARGIPARLAAIAAAIPSSDFMEIPRLNSRSWLVSQLTFLRAFRSCCALTSVCFKFQTFFIVLPIDPRAFYY